MNSASKFVSVTMVRTLLLLYSEVFFSAAKQPNEVRRSEGTLYSVCVFFFLHRSDENLHNHAEVASCKISLTGLK